MHRVPFYETEAMGIVHHAHYVHFLELARIEFLDQHDVPYRDYVARGLHFAVTRVEIRYLRGARFDDVVETTAWVSIIELFLLPNERRNILPILYVKRELSSNNPS